MLPAGGVGGSEQAERWETDCETGPSVSYFLVVDASPRAMAGIGKGAPYRRWIVQKQTGRAALLKQKVGGGACLLCWKGRQEGMKRSKDDARLSASRGSE
jgi:hypothetical protein